jgi:SAM-dependent methyltransferase
MTNNFVILKDVPFCIGAFDQPRNPDELPSTYPLGLWYEPNLFLVCQQQTPELDGLLQRSYRLGLEMGTPVSDSKMGKGYADDFLGFIEAQARPDGRALEIGAGVGYVSHCLKKTGWQVESVEPGLGYESQWEKYGVEVINEFFPTPRAVGPYNLIVSYAVLEHISDPVDFLRQIAAHMTADGKLVLAVPDCTEELITGDPGMLIHEHYFYFTEASLARLLAHAGFACKVQRAGYGRLLYAVAWQDSLARVEVSAAEIKAGRAYAQRCTDIVSVTRQLIRDATQLGTVGFFCPVRALTFLPQDVDHLRFFDDSKSLQGKYYPPFQVVVESRDALIAEPVDELWIMSRTFGRQLKTVLEPQIPGTRIRLLEEIIS